MKKKTKLIFYKMQGAGNDFIVIDATKQKVTSRKSLALKLCDRHFGVGADGVVFLEDSKKQTYKWDFYNSDGSSAEACMNASRCVVLYGQSIAKKKSPITFETQSGIMKGVVLKNSIVELELTNEFKAPQSKHVSISENTFQGLFINTGVPHFVVTQDQWSPENWKKTSYQIQKNHIFKPHETNVTWIQKLTPSKVRAITFERGVEDYTLACGTGAVAAALAASYLNPQSKVEVEMPGGKLVFFSKGKKNFLRGPAEVVYKGEV